MVAKVLHSRGVSHLFTLSGGHLFSIYDGCKAGGDRIVDVRHEQSAVFAAEGYRQGDPEPGCRGADRRARGDQRDQRDRRRPGKPLTALRARRPGAGDALGLGLAAGDRSPALRLAAGQVGRDREGAGPDRRATAAAIDLALAAPGGPTFVDYPLDVVFSEAELEIPAPPAPVAEPPSRGGRGGRGAAGRRPSAR